MNVHKSIINLINQEKKNFDKHFGCDLYLLFQSQIEILLVYLAPLFWLVSSIFLNTFMMLILENLLLCVVQQVVGFETSSLR